MIYLKSFDEATQYFDLESQRLLKQESELHKVFGWFKFIDTTLSALVVLNNKLYFVWGSNRFEINNYVSSVTSFINGDRKLFRLCNDHSTIVEFEYDVIKDHISVSPFEYLDDEDFDWGEFIGKIINDATRRINFINNLTGSQSADF